MASCCCQPLTPQRPAQPDSAPSGWEVHYDKLGSMPNAIPAAFAERWGQWCGEQGIKGKFSMVPFPAGVGRIDREFPGFPASELKDWLRVTREVIWKNFDLTPEMLTHTRVVDLKTWQLTEEWEQGEWVDQPEQLLTDYIAAAMQLHTCSCAARSTRCEHCSAPKPRLRTTQAVCSAARFRDEICILSWLLGTQHLRGT